MNIYELLRVVAKAALINSGEYQDATSLIDELERQNAFGTIARITSGQHRWTRESPISPNCAFCGKVKEDHNE